MTARELFEAFLELAAMHAQWRQADDPTERALGHEVSAAMKALTPTTPLDVLVHATRRYFTYVNARFGDASVEESRAAADALPPVPVLTIPAGETS